MGEKRYDRAYFDRWYRDEGFGAPQRVDRKLRYAVGAAEYLLDRPVRSVLDVGCGEGAWALHLRRLRPGARYVGIDPSEYAVARFGRTRGVRLGSFGALGALDLGGPFDLVVVCDVVPYLSDREWRAGLPGLAAAVGGLAFLEIWTVPDGVVGDLAGFSRRRARTYERQLRSAGLHRLGPHLYAGPERIGELAALERPPGWSS
jgi:SAM-dependent methyltransferase